MIGKDGVVLVDQLVNVVVACGCWSQRGRGNVRVLEHMVAGAYDILRSARVETDRCVVVIGKLGKPPVASDQKTTAGRQSVESHKWSELGTQTRDDDGLTGSDSSRRLVC